MAPWFEVEPKAWHIFSVFFAVIVSFILRPYPMGLTVLLGLLILVATGTISMQEALTGFADNTVWLVIAAFLIAGAVLHTGFGTRVALWLVVKLGRSLKGLAYAICGSEFVLGSVIPSNTARGGGIHAPIVDSIIHSLRDSSESHPSSRYLSLVAAHANLIAASTFMTGMAGNPLIGQYASEIFGIPFSWGTWLLGSIIPALVSMATLPIILGWLVPSEHDDVSAASRMARSQLAERGPMSTTEKIMLYVLLGMLCLWGTQFIHGLSTTFIAWLGVAILLLLEAQTWKEVIENSKAWETLFWLGGLLTMASLLVDYGFINWFVQLAKIWTTSISGFWLVIVLGLIYFYSMYAFSMLSGHIAAMVAPFFAVALAVGAEPMLTIAVFAYFSCLCGCLTNYSSGPVIIYFGLGHVKAPAWFRIGFAISVVHIGIWLGVGLPWWKFLGWW